MFNIYKYISHHIPTLIFCLPSSKLARYNLTIIHNYTSQIPHQFSVMVQIYTRPHKIYNSQKNYILAIKWFSFNNQELSN